MTLNYRAFVYLLLCTHRLPTHTIYAGYLLHRQIPRASFSVSCSFHWPRSTCAARETGYNGLWELVNPPVLSFMPTTRHSWVLRTRAGIPNRPPSSPLCQSRLLFINSELTTQSRKIPVKLIIPPGSAKQFRISCAVQSTHLPIYCAPLRRIRTTRSAWLST